MALDYRTIRQLDTNSQSEYRISLVFGRSVYNISGLEELNDATTFPSLHKLLDSVRRIDPAEKLTLGQEPYWDLWLPRQGLSSTFEKLVVKLTQLIPFKKIETISVV
jgi:hypothetical protein